MTSKQQQCVIRWIWRFEKIIYCILHAAVSFVTMYWVDYHFWCVKSITNNTESSVLLYNHGYIIYILPGLSFCFYPRCTTIWNGLLLILETRFVCARCSASSLLGYLQAFGRAGMPEPLDVRRRDPVGCAVKGLPAPPWHRARVLQRNRLLPYLRTHCQTRSPHKHTHK